MMRATFSFVFILLLLCPALLGLSSLPGHLHHGIHDKPPGWQPQALLQKEYYDAWTEYIRHRLSSLPYLVTMKRRLDLDLFAVSDVDGVYVGQNGWLYDQPSLHSYRKNNCQEKDRIREVFTGLKNLATISRLSGHPVVVSIVPNKATIYPEYLGKVPQDPDCGRSAYDFWLEAQARTTSRDFVRLDDRLKAAKTEGELYRPTGTTWTSLGIDTVSPLLVNRLLEKDTVPALTNDLTSRLLTGSRSPTNVSTSMAGGHQSSVLVYGGQSAAGLLPVLARAFDRVDRIDSLRFPSLNYHERITDYDAVLILLDESRLAEVRVDLDRWFAMLPLERVARDQRAIPLSTIRAERFLSIDDHSDQLFIKSMGADARFSLPALPGSEGDSLRLLRLTINAPQADTLTWADQLGTAGQNSRNLHPGLSVIYLPLAPSPSVRVSINPGKRNGIFRLKSAEVLEFSLPNGRGHPPVDDREGSTVEMAAANDGEKPSPPSASTPSTVSRAPQEISAPSITLNDVENGRIFQRKGTSADIVISGKYKGRPEAVEARVIRLGDGGIVVPWTVIDNTPARGIFMGILREVPQGGWYRMAVRFKGRHDIMDQGTARWGVGILVACIGQSNMEEWFYSGDDLTPHSLASLHRDGHWQAQPLRGNGAIAFTNRLIARTAVPVGLLDYAVNGSGLLREADWGTGYWADQSRQGIYRKLVDAVADTGGALEYVLWMQGEADAARGTISQRSYELALTTFIRHQLRRDIINGSSCSHLPVLIVGMVKRPVGKDIPHQAILNAQVAVTQHVPDCYLAAVTLDLKNHGRQHLAPAAYTTLGLRAAQTVLFLLGEEKYYRGPSAAGATRSSASTIDVHLIHRGGTDFTPTAHISGWEVLQGTRSIAIQEVRRYDPSTIRIRLAVPVKGALKVRYLYGAMPDTSNPVHDNSAMELPLEPFEQVIP